MDFKNLGENSIVHIIRKKPFLYETGTLKSKVAKQPNPYHIQPMPQSFDLVVTVNGNDEIIPGITDSMEVVDYKGSFYSSSIEGILQANDNLAQMAKTGLDEQPYYKSVAQGTENVRERLNPRYAEEKQRDRTINELQTRADAQDKKLDSILEILKEIKPKTKESI